MQFKRLKDGIFFLDEAYSLAQSDSSRDFGYNVINTLVNQMDIHRYDITFIFAGYKMEMMDFLKSNPGLKSRIPFKLEFANYNEAELFSIFKKFLMDKGYSLSGNAEIQVTDYFRAIKSNKFFGNGRVARNLAERTEIKQANRLIENNITTGEELNYIEEQDIAEAIASMQEPVERRIGFY